MDVNDDAVYLVARVAFAFFASKLAPTVRRTCVQRRRQCGTITRYVIDPNLCTQCVGHYDEPQCQQVCPVDCIPLDEAHPETQEQLMEKYRKITGKA